MDNKLKKIVYMITNNNYNILGSFNNPKIKFKSDIDIESTIKDDSLNKIILFLQNVIKVIKNNDNLYFIDFKSGNFTNTNPIKWTVEDIINGYKIYEDKKINLIDTLQDKSIIKLDFIYKNENGLYEDISVNYYFIIKDFKTDPNEDLNLEDIRSSLYNDYLYYKDNNNYYKALKRLYNYFELYNKNNIIKNNYKIQQNKILKIINSKYGIINQYINYFEIIKKLIDNNYITINEFYDYINKIKIMTHDKLIIKKLDVLLKHNKLEYIYDKLDYYINYFTNYINKNIISKIDKINIF